VILLQLKLTKLTLEIHKSDFQRKKEKIYIHINLQLTGKILLEFDFSSSWLFNVGTCIRFPTFELYFELFYKSCFFWNVYPTLNTTLNKIMSKFTQR